MENNAVNEEMKETENCLLKPTGSTFVDDAKKNKTSNDKITKSENKKLHENAEALEGEMEVEFYEETQGDNKNTIIDEENSESVDILEDMELLLSQSFDQILSKNKYQVKQKNTGKLNDGNSEKSAEIQKINKSETQKELITDLPYPFSLLFDFFDKVENLVNDFDVCKEEVKTELMSLKSIFRQHCNSLRNSNKATCRQNMSNEEIIPEDNLNTEDNCISTEKGQISKKTVKCKGFININKLKLNNKVENKKIDDIKGSSSDSVIFDKDFDFVSRNNSGIETSFTKSSSKEKKEMKRRYDFLENDSCTKKIIGRINKQGNQLKRRSKIIKKIESNQKSDSKSDNSENICTLSENMPKNIKNNGIKFKENLKNGNILNENLVNIVEPVKSFDNLRRSSRFRVPPLKYWAGEKIKDNFDGTFSIVSRRSYLHLPREIEITKVTKIAKKTPSTNNLNSTTKNAEKFKSENSFANFKDKMASTADSNRKKRKLYSPGDSIHC